MLVISQPVVVGEWCTLCLAAAAVMLAMIPLTVDEVVAMVQFMTERVRAGKPFWRTFWVGDTTEGGGPDGRTARYGAPLGAHVPAMAWGVSVPWSLAVSVALGLWIMVSPAVFATTGTAADSDHLIGALVLTIAAISTAEVIRACRFLNLLLAHWLIVGPWVVSGFSGAARWNDIAAGIVLIALTLPRGPVHERYARWDRLVV